MPRAKGSKRPSPQFLYLVLFGILSNLSSFVTVPKCFNSLIVSHCIHDNLGVQLSLNGTELTAAMGKTQKTTDKDKKETKDMKDKKDKQEMKKICNLAAMCQLSATPPSKTSRQS